MIEGIKFEVKAQELAEMFAERATLHRNRGEQQLAELPKLKQIIDSLKVPGYQTDGGSPGITFGNSQYAGRDPVADLESRIARHRTAAVKYDFYAKHVVADQTYRLSVPDLSILGLEADHNEIALYGLAIR